MYQNNQFPMQVPALAPGAYSNLPMNSRRARQVAQANAAANYPAANMSPQIAAAQIAELQGYMARAAQGGYAASPWSGATQAGGIGSPKSRILIRADLGSVEGMSIDQKAYTQVTIDAAGTPSVVAPPPAGQVFAVTGVGGFTLQCSLDDEDQASFNGKIIEAVGVTLSASGDFPLGFDSSQLENFAIKRSQLKVLRGGTANTQTASTLPFIAIVYSANFPKAGAILPIRNMSGVWSATKFLWTATTLPLAPALLTYQLDSDVILTYAVEEPGMHSI